MIKFAEETRGISLKAASVTAKIQTWVPILVLVLIVACVGSIPIPVLGWLFSTTIFAGSLLSLSSLVGMRLRMANKWWRFIIAPFAILAPAAVNGLAFGWVGSAIAGAVSIIVFLTLEVIKLRLGSFREIAGDKPAKDGLQFGIAQLMIATASLAVFISLVKFLLQFVGSPNIPIAYEIFIASAFVSAIVVFTLVNVWALMGSVVRYRLFASIAASLIVTVPLSFLSSNIESLAMWMSMLLICWIMIAFQLWFLRRAGLRFVRK